jgi:hypothetical protein
MSRITRSRGAERTGVEALIFAQLVPDWYPTLFFQPHRRIRRLRCGFVAAPEQMAENGEGRVCVRVAETLGEGDHGQRPQRSAPARSYRGAHVT